MKIVDKKILEACPNFSLNMTAKYPNNDALSQEIQSKYKLCVENADPTDFDLLNKLKILDKSVNLYFYDSEFEQIIRNKADILDDNMLEFLINECLLYIDDNKKEKSRWI